MTNNSVQWVDLRPVEQRLIKSLMESYFVFSATKAIGKQTFSQRTIEAMKAKGLLYMMQGRYYGTSEAYNLWDSRPVETRRYTDQGITDINFIE